MEVGPIRGDLIKWAREQRGLTLRAVYDQGGPSIGFQSEIENGRKREVHKNKLDRWLEILGASEAFIRGAYTPYHKDQAAAKGLASDMTDSIRALQAGPEWGYMSTNARLITVMRSITKARKLSALILAHVLSLDLVALEHMLAGTHPIPKEQIGAMADLVLLRPAELLAAVPDQHLLDQYGPVMRLALEKGVPADLIQQWLDELA